MTSEKITEFKTLFKEYKSSNTYFGRQKQKAIAVPFKEIIRETLKNEPLRNEHLTGLIQMFGWRCKPENFNKYLEICVTNKKKRQEISDMISKIGEKGFTAVGKTAIQKLHPTKLAKIKDFLVRAFDTHTIEEAIKLCEEFDRLQIPFVKQGIYSPWLFYINPEIFPMVNNSHHNFKKWFGFPASYPECIKLYHQFNKAAGESDLAAIDFMAHLFTKEGKLNFRRYLYLNGKRIFKISHGIFSKGYSKSGLAEILEENKWICMHRDTKKNQGEIFANDLKIGDYVYLCYGGDRPSFIGEITSKALPLNKSMLKMIDAEGEPWIYREVKMLFKPVHDFFDDEMKSHRYAYLPSGNSTFAQIPSEELEWVNDELFIPYYNIEVIEDKPIDNKSEAKSNHNLNPDNHSMSSTNNHILFGPPGTGKTFHSINYAVALVEGKKIEVILSQERKGVKKRFDQHVIDGQIVFCTFHQSLSYEDFIEGIKPIEPGSEEEELTYAVEDGIFKRLCTEAAFSFIQKNTTTETEKVLDFSSEYDRFVDMVNERFSKGEKTELETRSGGNVYIESISQKNNIWVRHTDGNRKYTVSKKRLSKISQAFPELSDVTNINDQFRAEIGGSNSSAYWAVLNAIRKQPAAIKSKDTKTISEKEYSYDDKKEIIESLKNDDYKIENPKKFVLIIDEINRGNVSQIFGELITLIEDDKRLGKEESLRAKLPYSKESFGVPCNIFIIGTMNTADRSVEALDTALRRRFSFIPMMPDESKLKITNEGIHLAKLLQTINNRLRVLKDNDHTIGHAWLWNVSNLQQLKIVFENKILPLLQEYFYNDYEKLGLVLGDTFFEMPHKRVAGNEFASFSGSNGLSGQYRNKYIYKLKNAEDLIEADFLTLTQAPVVNED